MRTACPPTPEPLGDAAVVFRVADRWSAAAGDLVRRAAALLAADPPPGVTDVLPTFVTLAVFFDPACADPRRVIEGVRTRLGDRFDRGDADDSADAGGATRPPLEVAVEYGGAAGPDLEAVAGMVGLSPADVVALHAGADHAVGMIGFAPGFPYLLGLPERLAIPRRAAPRTRVAAGSVAIAAGQTGIYPRSGPGGWHVIGRTALPLFDPWRDPPALLRAGDRVRFVPVAGPCLPAEPAASHGDSHPDLRGDVVVIVPGAATTVQDGGRPGWRAAGVGPGGAADDVALSVANLLVGNARGAAALEFAAIGPRLLFAQGARVALAGVVGRENNRISCAPLSARSERGALLPRGGRRREWL